MGKLYGNKNLCHSDIQSDKHVYFIRTCMSFIAFHPSSTDDMGIYLCSPGSKSWSKISSVSFSYLIASKVMMLMLFCKPKPKYCSCVLTCTMGYFHLWYFLFKRMFVETMKNGILIELLNLIELVKENI